MRRNFLQLPEKMPLHLPTFTLPTRGEKRPKTVRRAKPGPADRLALTEVRGHLTYTTGTVTAWYTLAEQVWSFRSDARREALLDAIATQYASLTGLNLTIRRTSVPFPVEQWAQALEANATPLPDDPTLLYLAGPAYVAPTWSRHITDAMGHLMAGQYTFGRTHLGVTFARPSRMQRTVLHTSDEALDKRVAEITEDLAAFGLQARTSTPAELAWLIHRSVGIGLNPPEHHGGDIDPDDIAEFVDNVDFVRGPYASTTQVTDRRTGEQAHVAVLTVGRMEAQDIPQVHQPWAHLSEEADFPVEWSSRIGIHGPAASRSPLERRRLMIRSQQRDYADHGLDEPLDLARLAERAAVVGDEIDTGLPAVSTRAHGWHRLAVHGATQAECLERVRALIRLYDGQSHITLTHPKAQYRLLREFIPGEPTVDTGYVRRMPVRLVAAAMPQATSLVGDQRGDLIGHTAGASNRPVFWDPHYSTEVRERSGLAVFVSEPGGGKSTLMGALGYLNARRGVRVTLVDPSGPLARLCQMPELRRHSRVVDLVGSQPGTLAPYALIPTPQRAEFQPGEAGDGEHQIAVELAEAERSMLALDICQMMLPPQVLDNADVILALREALRSVAPVETSTLDDVGRALDELGVAGNTAARTLAGELYYLSKMPLAKLFFGRPAPDTVDSDAALTVITMGGLQLPDLAIDRKHWSFEQTLAVPMLHLAGRLAVRRSYSGDMSARKFVGLDEAHFLEGWGSGRAFLRRLARDSRKWNVAALVASQNPRDILDLDVQNLVSTVFVGRIADDAEIAEEALRLLRVPVGVGYEATLAGLSQHADTASSERLGFREFVMRDVDNRVQKIRVDVTWVRGLLTHLDTTPGGTR